MIMAMGRDDDDDDGEVQDTRRRDTHVHSHLADSHRDGPDVSLILTGNLFVTTVNEERYPWSSKGWS